MSGMWLRTTYRNQPHVGVGRSLRRSWQNEKRILRKTITQTFATSNFLKFRPLVPNLFNIMSYSENEQLSTQHMTRVNSLETLTVPHPQSVL